MILGDWSPSLSTRNFKDCTDHRALDARGLVAQSISSELQDIALTTKRSMLGDWSYSIAMQNSKERTWCLGTGRYTIVHLGTGRSVDLIADEPVNLVFFRPCYKVHTSPSSKLGDYIGTMHLSYRISLRTFLLTLAPRAYVTYYQARGLSGHTSPCGQYACFFENNTLQKSKVGALHQERNLF